MKVYKSSTIFLFLLSAASLIFGKESENTEFSPWYTGPLITASGNCLKPGKVNFQPYLYYTDIPTSYSREHRKSKKSDITTLSESNSIQFGLLDFLDVTFTTQINYSHFVNINVVSFSDTAANFGIQLLRQKDHTAIPSIKLSINEIFPTGKYQHLDPDKLSLDSSGSGAYVTKTSLNISKIVYWIKNHPMSLRFVSAVAVPTIVRVKEFNTYGGGYNTRGKVRPPSIFSEYFSFEFSFTQRWVYAMDFMYSYATKTKFSGNPGKTLNGDIASCESPVSQVLTIAPAIEYNISENMGVLTGCWFTVFHKNASRFFSYMFSFTYTF